MASSEAWHSSLSILATPSVSRFFRGEACSSHRVAGKAGPRRAPFRMENPPPASVSTEAGEVEYDTPPSRWPVTFGVIAIAFGVLGFLSSAWSVIETVVVTNGDMFEDAGASGSEAAEAMARAISASWERWATASVATNAVLALLALFLVVAGIVLIQRKPISRPLLLGWSYAKIVFGIGAMVVQFQIQREQTSAIFAETRASFGGGASGGPMSMTQMDGIFSAVVGAFFFIGVLWVVALPVLLLIWLNRELVKADISTWK